MDLPMRARFIAPANLLVIGNLLVGRLDATVTLRAGHLSIRPFGLRDELTSSAPLPCRPDD
jgi:hypothetical protein